jgi:hypothetical protein
LEAYTRADIFRIGAEQLTDHILERSADYADCEAR